MLQELNPDVKGISERSVRRFCTSNNIRKRSNLSKEEYQKIIFSETSKTGDRYGQKMLIGSLRSIECNFAERQVGQALQSINSVASSQLKVNRCEHYDQNQKLGMQGAVHVCARHQCNAFLLTYLIADSRYKFGKKVSPLCSFCMEESERLIHLFHSCKKTNFLWTQLQISFQHVLIIPRVTPQNTIFGFSDHIVNYHLINHILLIFKYYVYKTREKGSLGLKVLKRNIHKIKNIEKQLSLDKPEKQKNFEQKWKPLLENIKHVF